jgi:hypothetical protein
MRYFSYMAEQSFKTGANGERLFLLFGPWAAPYVIPDAATEERLYRKLTWTLRILVGGLIVGQPFIFAFVPAVITNPMVFVLYVIGIIGFSFLAYWLIFASELRSLPRASHRLPLSSNLRQMGTRHSVNALLLGLACCFAFVFLGGLFVSYSASKAVTFISMGFFALCGLGWAYALITKLSAARVSHN